ncbi:MAG: hypothetical protein ACETWM_17060 [Candidatus Lokiarchaeia archaeon]
MAREIHWDKKINNLKSMREIIDYITELEANSYYVSRGFQDPLDSLAHQRPIPVKDLPFLSKESINITNLEKMIKKSNNLREIGKFIEKINCLSDSVAEQLVPIVCKKIDESKNLREIMLCLNQMIGRNYSQHLNDSADLGNTRDYRTIKLVAHIIQGLDIKKLEKKLAESTRVRDLWECLQILKMSWDTIAEQITSNLDINLIIEKMGKTKNPHNIGNLLKTLQEINPEKSYLILREAIEELRNSTNLTHIGTCLGGIAIFDIENAAALLPIIIDKMNSSNNLKEVGESFRKISLANRSIIPELFIGLNPDKQKHLQEKYGRYLKT